MYILLCLRLEAISDFSSSQCNWSKSILCFPDPAGIFIPWQCNSGNQGQHTCHFLMCITASEASCCQDKLSKWIRQAGIMLQIGFWKLERVADSDVQKQQWSSGWLLTRGRLLGRTGRMSGWWSKLASDEWGGEGGGGGGVWAVRMPFGLTAVSVGSDGCRERCKM